MGQACGVYLFNHTSYNIQLFDHSVFIGKLKFINLDPIPAKSENPLPLFEPDPTPTISPTRNDFWFSGTFRYTMTPTDLNSGQKTYAFEIVCQPHKQEGTKSILTLAPRYESEVKIDFPFIWSEPQLSIHVNNPVNIFEMSEIVKVNTNLEPIVIEKIDQIIEETQQTVMNEIEREKVEDQFSSNVQQADEVTKEQNIEREEQIKQENQGLMKIETLSQEISEEDQHDKKDEQKHNHEKIKQENKEEEENHTVEKQVEEFIEHKIKSIEQISIEE
jgi:hypothetical protein